MFSGSIEGSNMGNTGTETCSILDEVRGIEDAQIGSHSLHSPKMNWKNEYLSLDKIDTIFQRLNA